MSAHICTHMRSHACTHMRTHVHTCTIMYTHVHMYIHTHMWTHKNIYTLPPWYHGMLAAVAVCQPCPGIHGILARWPRRPYASHAMVPMVSWYVGRGGRVPAMPWYPWFPRLLDAPAECQPCHCIHGILVSSPRPAVNRPCNGIQWYPRSLVPACDKPAMQRHPMVSSQPRPGRR